MTETLKRVAAFLLASIMTLSLSGTIISEADDGNFANDIVPAGVILNGNLACDFGTETFEIVEEYGNAFYLSNFYSGASELISNDRFLRIAVDRSTFMAVKEVGGNSEIVISDAYNTQNGRTIYTINGIARQVCVTSDKIFYLSGGTIYSVGLGGGTPQQVYQDGSLLTFRMELTDLMILIKETEAGRNHVFGEGDGYEGTEDYVVESRLDLSSGIKNAAKTVIPRAQTLQGQVVVNPETVTVGSKSIPWSDYPVGSNFTNNESACVCHSYSSCCTSTTGCNCKRLYNGVDMYA